MRLLPVTALALLLAAPGFAPAEELLFLGNSYTASNDLAAVLDAMLESSGRASRVERNAPGGYRLPQHLADVQGANAQVQAWMTPGAEPWDFVVLQDQSQVPGLPEDEASFVESRAAAVELAARVQATSATTVLFLTWGRRTGDVGIPELYPDFSTMQDRLTAGYRSFATAAAAPDGAAPVYIAPVGEAFRAVHDALVADGQDPTADGTLFSDLYVGDGSHPSQLGTALAGWVFYAVLTGESPVGVPDPFGALPADRVAQLQELARTTVFDRDDFPRPVTAAGDDDDSTEPPVEEQPRVGCALQGEAGPGSLLSLLILGMCCWRRPRRSSHVRGGR